jgi:hypothetical protein
MTRSRYAPSPEKAICLNFSTEEIRPREIPGGDADDEETEDQLYIEAWATLSIRLQSWKKSKNL